MAPSTSLKVLIVGGGLGGITLGLLLEAAGVQYEIFERVASHKPLGSAIVLGCNVAAIYKQLGVWEEIQENSLITLGMKFFNAQCDYQCEVDFAQQGHLGGSDMYVIGRPLLHEILRRRIPAEKFHLDSKVVSFEQDEHTVKIHTSNNKTYEGDILVGADGAYSAVRQRVFESLQTINQLPAHDSTPMPFRFLGIIGQTVPLDPKEYPEVLSEVSPFNAVISESNYACMTLTTKEGTNCWQAFRSLDETGSKAHAGYQNAEWGPEAAEQMCKEVQDQPFKGGDGSQTFGDLIAKTPKEFISKIAYEEKVFETWYHGRTVLMGDAVHKLHPAGGVGAVSAIIDAVTLANWINTLPNKVSQDELTSVFKEYRDERLPEVKTRMAISQTVATLLAGSLGGRVARLALTYMPKFVVNKMAYDNCRCRPQVAFLPEAEDTGVVPRDPQPSLEKTRLIMQQRKLQEQPSIPPTIV